MLIPQKYIELKSFFDKIEFVTSTIDQISKDLQGLYKGDFSPTLSNSPDILNSLISELKPILITLSNYQPEQLSQFVYRVDLNESLFMASLNEDTSLQDLSFRIIEREAQKVYLRFKFS